MANTLLFAPPSSFKSPSRPGVFISDPAAGKAIRLSDGFLCCGRDKFQCLKVKATENDKTTKSSSIVCGDCDGNGAIQCTQCKGNGVNSVDHFNGQFKAGGLCWLCRGKKDILCGGCNGAGFRGGFMSSFDD